ncbi:hypothetical protein EAG_01053 [Camponotus floridanus]|uniref:Uncharacterized protein n=1 Tax=Camponotus floridanus TaxID=104421 RepID=E2AB37_CAMFO|nr:hypothetical protein EAG_01053 [Camponotus floridanus]
MSGIREVISYSLKQRIHCEDAVACERREQLAVIPQYVALMVDTFHMHAIENNHSDSVYHLRLKTVESFLYASSSPKGRLPMHWQKRILKVNQPNDSDRSNADDKIRRINGVPLDTAQRQFFVTIRGGSRGISGLQAINYRHQLSCCALTDEELHFMIKIIKYVSSNADTNVPQIVDAYI